MGRWAQRKRSGGSAPNAVADDTFIVGFHLAGSGSYEVVYNQEVTAGDFTATDFETHPSDETGLSVGQIAPNSLELTNDAMNNTDTSVTYSGPTPPANSPQTFP